MSSRQGVRYLEGMSPAKTVQQQRLRLRPQRCQLLWVRPFAHPRCHRSFVVCLPLQAKLSVYVCSNLLPCLVRQSRAPISCFLFSTENIFQETLFCVLTEVKRTTFKRLNAIFIDTSTMPYSKEATTCNFPLVMVFLTGQAPAISNKRAFCSSVNLAPWHRSVDLQQKNYPQSGVWW